MRLFRRMPLGKQQWERPQLREAVDRICLKTMSKPSIEALKNHWHMGMDLRDRLVWLEDFFKTILSKIDAILLRLSRRGLPEWVMPYVEMLLQKADSI
jgi:hypothetical protein